ncbi:Sorting nexin mvp1 [Basidiobolus ranarum]|uniref:Sorting nexin MVP1 n=1 Tax=Basidiobolus ranarum TaxID=34480 RepID=A0ABR2W6C5_9FUNG
MYEDDMTASFFQSNPETISPPQSAYFSTTSVNPALGDLANPWGPQGSGSISIDTVLDGIKLAPIYETAFTLANPINDQITKESLDKILSLSGLSSASLEKILTVGLPVDRSSIDRKVFDVLLTLVALCQKNMEVSLENIVTHKQDLPTPLLPNLSSIDFTRKIVPSNGTASVVTKPERSAGESDPWRTDSSTIVSSNDLASVETKPERSTGESDPWRTESNPIVPIDSIISDKPLGQSRSDGLPVSNGFPTISNDAKLLMEDDLISVQISLQKGGMIFKHVNYTVESKQHLSSVVRRYSDFWWLLEILSKRYPSRMLPTIPPKRIGGDEAFLERRRKGLTRFINFIGRHPVLKKDDITIVFLTEPTDMGSYRKLHKVSIDGEFRSIEVTDHMKAAIPHNLDEKLNTLRGRLDASIEYYNNQCMLMERITKRQGGTSDDILRYSQVSKSLAENDKECHDIDCYSCPQIANGINMISDCFKQVSSIKKREVDSSVNGVVESLRRQKEVIISFKELLERKDKIITSEVDTLASRIQSNQEKLNHLRSSNGSAKEIQKLTSSIEQDQKEIIDSRKHEVFIQYCLWCELQFYHQNAAFATLLYQHYISDQIKFNTEITQAWTDLSRVL